MKQEQESEQLFSSRSLNSRDYQIECTVTEHGLVVRVINDTNEHQTNVYEGIVDKKQLTDGSPIAENFDTLEEIQEFIQDPEHTRVDFTRMAL